MLSSKIVVLDVGRHRKENFIVEQLDCVSFLPPTRYSDLTTHQKQSFQWLTGNLHGIERDRGTYPSIFLTQIFGSVSLRNTGAFFSAKGDTQVNFLSELLESIIDLNLLECLSISVNYFTQNCRNHSKRSNSFNKNCAKEKAIFDFNWLTNERGIDESGGTPVTEFNNLCLDYGGWESEFLKSQKRNHKNQKPFFREKLNWC